MALNLHIHKRSHCEHEVFKMEGCSRIDSYDDTAQPLVQPTPTSASSECETAIRLFLGRISTIFAYLRLSLFGLRISMKATTVSPCTSSSTVNVGSASAVAANCEAVAPLMSTRIQRMMERRREHARDVDVDIETSKDHWSETLEAVGARPRVQGTAHANKETFESLRKRWGGFFVDRGHLWEVRDKIAEGAQAEIFNAARVCPDGKTREGYVLKVFKDGNPLKDLQNQWPQGMLHRSDYSGFGFEHYATKNLLGGVLLKDGRFAFEMWKDWGDLRKLIDLRMEQNGNHSPPFTDEEVGRILLDIARGMQQLHKNKIVHRDLKASNVLIVRYKDYRGTTNFTPANDNFHCAVADYECSRGIVGTGYWRAPEILDVLQNPDAKPYSNEHLFTEKVDVYSFGMTCYEVLTGKIPFEELPRTAYNVILDGKRPDLPAYIRPAFKALLTRCWLSRPLKRPSFEDIVNDLEKVEVGRQALGTP